MSKESQAEYNTKSTVWLRRFVDVKDESGNNHPSVVVSISLGESVETRKIALPDNHQFEEGHAVTVYARGKYVNGEFEEEWYLMPLTA